MRLFWITPAFLLATSVDARAQAATPPGWASLVPPGFHITETVRGDLNQDGQDDVVLIVKASDPARVVANNFGQRVDRNRRGILIAFKDHDRYRLAMQNLALFSSENEDGGVYYAPELDVTVSKGKLFIHYAHGRYGYWQYTFRYQHEQFELIGYDRSDDRGPVVLTFTSINLLSGKVLKRVNKNEEAEPGNERFVETWSKIPSPRVIALADIADLDQWSVEQALGLPR